MRVHEILETPTILIESLHRTSDFWEAIVDVTYIIIISSLF